LDLTKPTIAEEWGYQGGNASASSIGERAQKSGYNVIRFNSERGVGVNYVVFENLNVRDDQCLGN
jgi:hypothetical protein